MLKISRMSAIALLALSAQISWADSRTDAMVGGALGGVIGSLVGAQIGGRDGAVVGAGLGAAAGVAITANHGHRDGRYERARYVDERCDDEYRGGYRGHDRGVHRGHYDRGYYADRGDYDRHEERRSRYYH